MYGNYVAVCPSILTRFVLAIKSMSNIVDTHALKFCNII